MRRAALLLALALVAPGCGEGLRFTRDARLEFVAPADREVVQTPVALRWRMQRPPGDVFAVFVDRPPVPPGRPIESVAAEDPLCRPEVRCPDARWLADRGIRLTRRSQLVLDALPAARGRKVGGRRLHVVTVVLLDRHGVRRDESAWRLSFFTPEPRL